MIHQKINFYPEEETSVYKHTGYTHTSQRKHSELEIKLLCKEALEEGYIPGKVLQNKLVPTHQLEIIELTTNPTNFFYLNGQPAFIKCKSLFNPAGQKQTSSEFGYTLEELRLEFTVLEKTTQENNNVKLLTTTQTA